ncbi:hypothetical protein U9R90_32685 [Streptomyces sp. E11-3]|uniref:hypothetical protein n=1 Tax=Streptomyces sp. E11-3 TaxID=3110112 RepID=UPI00398056F4
MASRRIRHRRRSTAIVAVCAALSATLAVGCSTVEKAIDCARTADVIAESAADLQQTVEDAAQGRSADTDKALDDIDKNITEINEKTDDADVGKALDSLGEAVGNVRTAIKDGDPTPDISPVTDATGELTKACKP